MTDTRISIKTDDPTLEALVASRHWPIDPFQNAVPCWLKTSHPPARWDRRTIAEQLGQPPDTNDWVICPDCKRSHGPCVSCDVLES